VAIDRAEDGDAIHHTPASPDASGGVAVLRDPERREAMQRFYHALVDHTYGVARDAWAQAYPGLCDAWQRHVEKYPERERPTPRSKPDGSWEADEARRLTPEQNAELDRGIGRIREVGKNVIVPGMRAVEAEDASRCLAGFDNRFKSEDRLKEKVTDRMRSKGYTPSKALDTIPDVVRFTLEYSETMYTAAVQKDIGRLEARGFIQVERRNTWADDQYKGINSRWREPESEVTFEVQFHTRASLEAKELTHNAYERIRGSGSDEERPVLKEFQRRVNSVVPTPPGVTEIEDYPTGDT
jgi:hypothetical protein